MGKIDKKILEQEKVLQNDKKKMLVSASAGSGKTFVMIKYITKLVCEEKIPVKDLVVLTFTKAAANEMKERLLKSLKEKGNSQFIIEQIDTLPTANISTIHAFCEKCLKKYANLIGINENFDILDENADKKLKGLAFDNALKILHAEHEDGYLILAEIYKNNNEKIKEILFEIEDIVESVADRQEFLKQNIENAENFFDKAVLYLYKKYKQEIQACLDEIEALHVPTYHDQVALALKPICDSKNLFEMSRCEIVLPPKPNVKLIGEGVSADISKIKDKLAKVLDELKSLNILDEKNVQFQRDGVLEKIVLKLFTIYENEKNKLKTAKNVLSFSDLEKYMAVLSQKENLFAGIKYVFVDEYQDTNKIQERIVKNVAKNCKFVAVGDVKQGIYGFRLASCEIFMKDVEDFSSSENATVNYLKSNFRSDQIVLDFVNDIFKVCMTKKSAGVDYLASSMLQGEKEFKQDGKTINIDLVVDDIAQKEELPDIYSVKQAQTSLKHNDFKMLLDIKQKIYEVLTKNIYEDDKFRPCRYKDIAILSRKRSELFNNLDVYLNQCGIPVNANSKMTLMDEVENKILLNLLKLALNFDDEIALLSVLLSPFGHFTLEEIATVKDERSLIEIVKNEEKFGKFVEKINNFSQNCMIFGIKKAFLMLFDDSMYCAYLNLKKGRVRLSVDQFLNEIEQSEFNFDIAGLINYLESVKIDMVAEPSGREDSVTLTTVHDSKGLEYPVVFLIGCDQSLSRGRENHDVKINEDFGFAQKYYDTENNSEVVGVKMRAIADEKQNKEFIEELMIFYVALTRAKNKLYLFGKFNEKNFIKTSLGECDSYYDFIFYALKDVAKEFVDSHKFEDKNISVNLIEEIEEKKFDEKQNLENSEFNQKDLEKIASYLNFKYKYDDKLNFKLKESVTELNHKNIENQLEKYSNDSFVFSTASTNIGNAYHALLELIDFNKLENAQGLHEQIINWGERIENIQYVNEQLLWKNIQIIKQLATDGKIFKEKEFILKEKLCNLVKNTNSEDEIMVQGVVDMFVIKDDEIVLVDYKYSNSNNKAYLVERYKNQLKFYKIALENYFKKPVKHAYLLSLKVADLIEVDL